MNTVFVVHGWMLGEEDFLCAIFENEEDAITYCQLAEEIDEFNYQYSYKQWEVK